MSCSPTTSSRIASLIRAGTSYDESVSFNAARAAMRALERGLGGNSVRHRACHTEAFRPPTDERQQRRRAAAELERLKPTCRG